jgi:hypothetical protein
MSSAAGGRRGGAPGHTTRLPAPTPAAGRARIIAFPLVHRRELKALATRMLSAGTDEAAERILQKRIAQLGRRFRAKKVSDAVVSRQLRSIEAAVRTQLWRVMFTEGRGP